jgi:hypothetical protein
VQVEPVHAAVPCSPPLHMFAQAPQLLGLLLKLTHAPEQFWVPAVQLEVHFPPEQTSLFCAQAFPQPPQLPGSESVFTQASPHLA